MKYIINSCIVLLSFYLSACYMPKHKQKIYKVENKCLSNIFFSDSELNYLSSLKSFIHINKGDFIADIGAGYGERTLALSVICDSVTFYFQDIEGFNSKRYKDSTIFENDLESTNYLRKTIQTNVIKSVLGTERNTNLPNNTFDKIIIQNTLHEFKYINDMLSDIYSKLKIDGKLIIDESFSKDGKPYIIAGCQTTAFTEKDLLSIMKKHLFYPVNILYPNCFDENVLMFSKNKIESDSFNIKKETVNKRFNYLSLLDTATIALDSINTNAIYDSLKISNFTTPIIENYINKVGYRYLEKANYVQAINVLTINVKLFPNSWNAYDSLGEAYLKNKQYALSKQNYHIALKLNPESRSSKEALKKIKKLQ